MRKFSGERISTREIGKASPLLSTHELSFLFLVPRIRNPSSWFFSVTNSRLEISQTKHKK